MKVLDKKLHAVWMSGYFTLEEILAIHAAVTEASNLTGDLRTEFQVKYGTLAIDSILNLTTEI